eukprot:TRINITY_DN2808_c0_g2_i1.p1 TRINITY_DN2808_c0_g2~~TRINITY_DN2808_c0_g2_i1.p1  ORF type:complete len:325 (-),score=114.35 TRINITY_DN2808_c0_g2_i1:157-1131(-)
MQLTSPPSYLSVHSKIIKKVKKSRFFKIGTMVLGKFTARGMVTIGSLKTGVAKGISKLKGVRKVLKFGKKLRGVFRGGFGKFKKALGKFKYGRKLLKGKVGGWIKTARSFAARLGKFGKNARKLAVKKLSGFQGKISKYLRTKLMKRPGFRNVARKLSGVFTRVAGAVGKVGRFNRRILKGAAKKFGGAAKGLIRKVMGSRFGSRVFNRLQGKVESSVTKVESEVRSFTGRVQKELKAALTILNKGRKNGVAYREKVDHAVELTHTNNAAAAAAAKQAATAMANAGAPAGMQTQAAHLAALKVIQQQQAQGGCGCNRGCGCGRC